jgi:glycosyltransferase involved in cell wall biosynthesis
MKISMNSEPVEESQVRGIGSYQQMFKEAVSKYGEKNDLEITTGDSDVNLITDFNFFHKLEVNPTRKNILVLHDLIPLEYPTHFPVGWRGKYTSWQNQQKLKKLCGVITDTHFVKELLVKKLSLLPHRVMVVPPAVKAIFEEGKGKPSSNFSNLPEQFILYVGDITWNKNLPNLAEAIKLINQPLVLVGAALLKKNNLAHPWLRSFCQFKQITEGNKLFITPGFVTQEEIKDLYQKARLVTLPSIAEGFGFPWLEAAWMETPVVLGESAVTREVAGDEAIFVDPFKPKAIAEGLEAGLFNDHKNLVKRAALRAQLYRQANYIVKLKEALYNLLNA